MLLQARRYDEALEQLRRTLEMAQNFFSARALAAYVYAKLGKKDEAFAEFDRLVTLRSDRRYLDVYRALLHADLGDTDVARDYLAHAKDDTDPGFVGLVYATLGDADEAFAYLNRAFDEKELGALNDRTPVSAIRQ